MDPSVAGVKNSLSVHLKNLQLYRQNAVRLTPEEFRDSEIFIAECRNLLNCIEEQLPHVRP